MLVIQEQARELEPNAEPDMEVSEPEPTTPVFTRHTVEKFDNLRKIAELYGVTSEAIQELNNLKDPNHIWIGQRLKIPQQP